MIHTDTRGSLNERNVVFLRYSTTERFSVFYNSVLVFRSILQQCDGVSLYSTTVCWYFEVFYIQQNGVSQYDMAGMVGVPPNFLRFWITYYCVHRDGRRTNVLMHQIL